MFLTDLADKLRAYRDSDGEGLTVVEVDGWQYRTFDGNGMAGNVGVIHHHTATAESAYAYSDCPTLSLLVNGRSDLPGPLCNIAFGRSGTVYVVAAGQANHAGRGQIPGVGYENLGNYYTIGIEAESSGVRDDWTEAQRRVWHHLGAALDEAYSGGDVYYQVGHREYSYDGKIDPSYIDLDKLRDDINTALAGGDTTGSTTTTAAGATAAAGEGDWLEMASKEDVKNAVREVLNEPIAREGGEKGNTSLITEAAWRTARDNRLERRLDVIGSRVFHLWTDLRLGVSGRVSDGALGSVFRRLGYAPDEAKRAEDFKNNEKKGWL